MKDKQLVDFIESQQKQILNIIENRLAEISDYEHNKAKQYENHMRDLIKELFSKKDSTVKDIDNIMKYHFLSVVIYEEKAYLMGLFDGLKFQTISNDKEDTKTTTIKYDLEKELFIKEQITKMLNSDQKPDEHFFKKIEKFLIKNFNSVIDKKQLPFLMEDIEDAYYQAFDIFIEDLYPKAFNDGYVYAKKS